MLIHQPRQQSFRRWNTLSRDLPPVIAATANTDCFSVPPNRLATFRTVFEQSTEMKWARRHKCEIPCHSAIIRYSETGGTDLWTIQPKQAPVKQVPTYTKRLNRDALIKQWPDILNTELAEFCKTRHGRPSEFVREPPSEGFLREPRYF